MLEPTHFRVHIHSSKSVWWHHLLVVIPTNVDPTCDMAMMYITGGENRASDIPKADDEEPLIVSILAEQMRCAYQMGSQRLLMAVIFFFFLH